MNREQELIKEIERLEKLDKTKGHMVSQSVFDLLQAELKGIQSQKQKIIEEIEKIDTQIPDDDGIPVDISAEEFKKEILKSLGEKE